MFSDLRRRLFGTTADQRKALREFDPNRPTGPEERTERFMNAAYTLYWQAERTRARARSYRHFCVGCGVFAYREDLPLHAGRFRAWYGMNSKPSKEGRNICAEPVAIDSAAAIAYTEVVGMVIVAETQENERGEKTLTLHPCPHCRLFMRDSPIIKPETLIITALPPPHAEAEWEEITKEVQTFKELCELYDET